MKPTVTSRQHNGFTFVEMLVVVAVVTMLAVLLLPELANARKRAQLITCNGYLKQISLGYKQWSLDRTNALPMDLATNLGGTKEWIPTGETFRHFEVISNELNTPYMLVCPADSGRLRVRSFHPALSNSNVSYFIGLLPDDSQPQMILAGDRNIWNAIRPINGVVGLTTNNTTGWAAGLHEGKGNLALADGSVQVHSASSLREALGNTGVQTNWVQLP